MESEEYAWSGLHTDNEGYLLFGPLYSLPPVWAFNICLRDLIYQQTTQQSNVLTTQHAKSPCYGLQQESWRACSHPSELNTLESKAHPPGSRPRSGHEPGTGSRSRSDLEPNLELEPELDLEPDLEPESDLNQNWIWNGNWN